MLRQPIIVSRPKAATCRRIAAPVDDFLGRPGVGVYRHSLVLAACVSLVAPLASQTTFRSTIELVNLGVAVLDRQGVRVDDLKIEDFEVLESGRKQDIKYFLRGDEDAPQRPALHVGLLFDTSGSMHADIQLARSAAIRFLNRVPHAEDYTIVDFDTEVRAATYGQNDFARLVERLRGRRPDGWTALYDALAVYLGGTFDQSGQKVLVLFTDGGDTRSQMTFAEALTTLRATDVTVYAIGFLQNQSHFTKNEQRLQLQQIADTTGGEAFFPSSMKDIEKVYDRILEELEGRYLLGYVSSNTRMDGAWRPVQIRLKRSELRGAIVRTRKGYYAPTKAEPGQ
jgi:Ca-activated chloride channel homolog